MFDVQNKVSPNWGHIPPISPILFMKLLIICRDLNSINISDEILFVLNEIIYIFIDVEVHLKLCAPIDVL